MVYSIQNAEYTQPLIATDQVHSQASPCRICGVQSGTMSHLCQSTLVFLFVSFHQCSSLIHSSPINATSSIITNNSAIHH